MYKHKGMRAISMPGLLISHTFFYLHVLFCVSQFSNVLRPRYTLDKLFPLQCNTDLF